MYFLSVGARRFPLFLSYYLLVSFCFVVLLLFQFSTAISFTSLLSVELSCGTVGGCKVDGQWSFL